MRQTAIRGLGVTMVLLSLTTAGAARADCGESVAREVYSYPANGATDVTPDLSHLFVIGDLDSVFTVDFEGVELVAIWGPGDFASFQLPELTPGETYRYEVVSEGLPGDGDPAIFGPFEFTVGSESVDELPAPKIVDIDWVPYRSAIEDDMWNLGDGICNGSYFAGDCFDTSIEGWIELKVEAGPGTIFIGIEDAPNGLIGSHHLFPVECKIRLPSLNDGSDQELCINIRSYNAAGIPGDLSTVCPSDLPEIDVGEQCSFSPGHGAGSWLWLLAAFGWIRRRRG